MPDTLTALLLTKAETARLLAISERKLDYLTAAGEIRRLKIGNSVRYDPVDLRAWIQTKKGEANGSPAKGGNHGEH
jgi:excisionase family DNA binding protein